MTGTAIGSLFSGYSGLDLGVQAALGGSVAWHVETDPAAAKVLTHHWPTVDNLGDITEIEWETMKQASNRKLTPDQVASSVEMYETGMSLAQIAEYFDVSRQAMWDLLRRRTTMRPQQRYGADNHFCRGGANSSDKAHNVAEKAIAAGRLTRPDRCERCGGSGQEFRDGRHPIQAHHCDYNKPLDVTWLCQPCHHEWHRVNTAKPVEGGGANGSLADIDVLTGGFP